MSTLELKRLGFLMSPEPGNPHEVEGVLNPAAMRGPDGKLCFFPRSVGAGNFSRIGSARVLFVDAGDPCGVERLGIALEPEADYELRSDGSGGCEDPRITFVEPLRRCVMTYTALPHVGPRIILSWLYPKICSTGNAWGLRPSSRSGASTSLTWTTKTPASSLSPFRTPQLPQERRGVVSNVVLPTGMDRGDDRGQPNRFDVYYSMADHKIGTARLDLPESLLPEGVADPPAA